MAVQGMNGGSADVVLNLLEQVGAGLQRLTIEGASQDRAVSGAWFGRLLQVCPKLESLELNNVSIDGLQVFLDSYVSGTCQLKRLALIKTQIVGFKSSLMDFVATLGDSNHPITRCLDEFVYHRPQFDFLAEPETVVSMVAMLEHNRRLRILDLQTSCVAQDRHEKRRHVKPVCEFDNQQLGRRKNHADSKRQRAFLSLLSPRLRDSIDGRTNHAMETLDARVLSLIFEFAARPQRRCVSVSFDLDAGW